MPWRGLPMRRYHCWQSIPACPRPQRTVSASSSSASATSSACLGPATGPWRARCVDLAASALARAATSAAASAILTSLAREIGEMTSFAVQLDDHVLYIASAEPPQELTLWFRAGRKAPLFCTSSGRLFLARLDDEALDQYLRNAELPAFTRYTNTDARKLRAELKSEYPQPALRNHPPRVHPPCRGRCRAGRVGLRRALRCAVYRSARRAHGRCRPEARYSPFLLLQATSSQQASHSFPAARQRPGAQRSGQRPPVGDAARGLRPRERRDRRHASPKKPAMMPPCRRRLQLAPR